MRLFVLVLTTLAPALVAQGVPSTRIVGRVVDDEGRAAAGASLFLQARTIPGLDGLGKKHSMRVRCDGEGRFSALVRRGRRYLGWASLAEDGGAVAVSGAYGDLRGGMRIVLALRKATRVATRLVIPPTELVRDPERVVLLTLASGSGRRSIVRGRQDAVFAFDLVRKDASFVIPPLPFARVVAEAYDDKGLLLGRSPLDLRAVGELRFVLERRPDALEFTVRRGARAPIVGAELWQCIRGRRTLVGRSDERGVIRCRAAWPSMSWSQLQIDRSRYELRARGRVWGSLVHDRALSFDLASTEARGSVVAVATQHLMRAERRLSGRLRLGKKALARQEILVRREGVRHFGIGRYEVVRSDTDGAFRVAGLAAKERVRLWLPLSRRLKRRLAVEGVPASGLALIYDGEARGPRELDVDLERLPRLLVRAVDSQGESSGFASLAVVGSGSATSRREPEFDTVCDANGRALLIGANAPRRVFAFGHNSYALSAIAVTGQAVLRVRLEPIRRMSGRLVDAKGSALAGHDLSVALSRTHPEACRIARELLPAHFSATSDAQGRFALGVPHASTRLELAIRPSIDESPISVRATENRRHELHVVCSRKAPKPGR